jgi:hypothetical protein
MREEEMGQRNKFLVAKRMGSEVKVSTSRDYVDSIANKVMASGQCAIVVPQKNNFPGFILFFKRRIEMWNH